MLLLIKGHKDATGLGKQIELLTDVKYTYTGAGLFVDFEYADSISEHKVDIEEVLTGVLIESPELQLGAEANLFFNEGIIDYLEVFARASDYPEKELDKYTLSRE